MGRKKRFHGNRQKKHQTRGSHVPPPLAPLMMPERKPPVAYGKPFTLMEDENKMTFEFNGGSWVPYAMTIAECRERCQVQQLPQKVNRMTRYEVRRPMGE
ncbi:MAG: hypothetical protein WD063_07665 [Pirellulales bacterium]